MSPEVATDLSLIATFLARRDIADFSEQVQPLDVIVLAGNSVLASVDVVANAFKSGYARRVLICGGVGHATSFLRDAVRRVDSLGGIVVDERPESHILADVLAVTHDIQRSDLLIEDRSTNCGDNAWQSRRVLEEQSLRPETLAIVQDPTMQRRSHASFERAWRGSAGPRFVSFAPVLPTVTETEVLPADTWPLDRFVSLVLGEVPRLRDDLEGYGPRGRDFIEHVEIPSEVLEAHERVSARLSEMAGRSRLGPTGR